MTTIECAFSGAERAQHRYARLAGFLFRWLIISGLAGALTISHIVGSGTFVETEKRVAASEHLYRVALSSELIETLSTVLLAFALYVTLKPIDKLLAQSRCIAGWAKHPSAAWAWQTLARLHIATSYDAYYVGPFWGLASTVCSYLWCKSRYIPRALATFGVISSAWCVICAFTFIVFPHFDATVNNASWFDVPMVIFEMALGFGLLFKGLSLSGMAQPGGASGRTQAGAA